MNKTKHFQNCLGVFQGGGVKAIAYAGAYEEATNRSVFFSELIGASAGSIVAVLVAAGASPEKINDILENLEFSDFLRPPIKVPNIKVPPVARIPSIKRWQKFNQFKTFSKYLGLYDSSYIKDWINEKLKELLRIEHNPRFSDLYIPTTVIATNIKNRSAQLWSTHNTPDFEVAIAVQNSCLMPFLFQPNENTFVDGGLLSNLPSYVLKPENIFDKILAFGFNADLENKVEFQSCEDYILGLANTVVDGAVEIQLKLQENVFSILIDTLGIKSTDFKKLNKELVQKLVEQGRIAAKDFFDNEETIKFQMGKRDDVALDSFESFNLLLRSMYSSPTEILISDADPTWMYSLFPLMLKWNRSRVHIRVLLKKNGEPENHRPYKIRLMEALGFNVMEVEEIPFCGFIIDGHSTSGSAIILSNPEKKEVHSTYLEGRFHYNIINILRDQFNKLHTTAHIPESRFNVERTSQKESITHFEKIGQYSDPGVNIQIKEVEISSLVFLTKWIKGYKYRQADEVFKLYKNNKIDLFEPITLNFNSNKKSLVTPPVIEVHGTESIVIEGNARLLYAYKNKEYKVKAIVVYGVSEPLPSSGRFSINQLLVSDKLKSGVSRYVKFDKDRFRKIEESIHDPLTSLL